MINRKSLMMEKIYIFFVCLFCFMSILSSTYIDDIINNYGKIFSIMQNVFVIIFSCLAIVNIKVTKKTLLIIYIFLLIICLILMKNNDKSFLVLIMMLFALPKNFNLSKLSKYIILTNFFSIALIIVLSKIGLITDRIFVQRDVIRHGFGFVSANAFSNLVTATIVLYIFHKKENITFTNIILCCILLFAVSEITNSRAAMLIGFISIFIIILLKRTIKKTNSIINKLIFVISKYIFLVLFAFTVIFTIYISTIPYNTMLSNLNELFTGRINQLIEFYNLYGIHLIGSPIVTIGIKNALASGQKWVGIDMAYLNYTLRYGMIFMIFLSFLYMKMCKKLKENNLVFESAYIIIICIMGLTENILLLPYYNFALFLIANNLKQKRQGEM